MLVTLGLDSAVCISMMIAECVAVSANDLHSAQMGGLEAVITGLMDEFNFKTLKREHFTAIVLCTSFLGTLINCTQVRPCN